MQGTHKTEPNIIIDIPVVQYIKHKTAKTISFFQIRHASNGFENSFSPITTKEWNALIQAFTGIIFLKKP